MQTVQQRSGSNFNNPLPGLKIDAPYYMDDLNSSQRGTPTQTDNNGVNGQNPINNRSQSQDIVIDFQPNFTEGPIMGSLSNVEPGNNNSTNNEVQSQNNAAPQNDITEQDVLIETRKDIIINIIKWNVLSFAVSTMIALVVSKNISHRLVFVLFWLYNTYNIVGFANKVNQPREKSRAILGILTNFISALFKVFLIIQIETKSFKLIVPLIPVVLCEIASSIIRYYYNRKYAISIFYKFEILFKFLLVAQAILIVCKMDGFIQWNWREVFCAYWLIFAIGAGITFASGLMFMGKCCSYMFGELETSEFRAITWGLLTIGGKTILSCALILKVIDILQDNNIKTLVSPLLTLSAYNLGLIAFTLMFKKEIYGLFNKLAGIEVGASGENDQAQDKEKASPKQEPEKVDIPKFLTKFSSTYFRRATGEEVETAKTVRKNKDNKNKKDDVPLIKPLKKRQNSVDYLKMKNSQITGNTTYLNLLTVHETEGERTKTLSDNWANTSRFGLRIDKGKDFFSGITDRTGVSGIIPSGIITSKTDRFLGGDGEARDFSPLTSNDSYMLPPISKDTDAPFMAFKNKEKRDENLNKGPLCMGLTPDISPIGRSNVSPLGNMDVSPLEIPERDREESFDLPTFKHRRVNSMQHFTSARAISLMEAVTSPKVRESARIDIPEGIKSPTSDTSNAAQCLICFDNLPDAVFMECGHGGVCYECSLEIWKSTNECYLCRDKITQVLQVDAKGKVGNNVIKVLSSTQMVIYEDEA